MATRSPEEILDADGDEDAACDIKADPGPLVERGGELPLAAVVTFFH